MADLHLAAPDCPHRAPCPVAHTQTPSGLPPARAQRACGAVGCAASLISSFISFRGAETAPKDGAAAWQS